LLGVRAVIAESYERIHRSNLVGMGVLPFQFQKNDNRKSLKLTGSEKINILKLENKLVPKGIYNARIIYANGKNISIKLKLLVSTSTEIEYLKTGGILQYVYKKIANS